LTLITPKYLINSLGKQIISNLTPSYASFLLFGYIFGYQPTDERLATYLFSATIAAIALSAIQPRVLRFVLFPSRKLEELVRRAEKKMVKESFKAKEVDDETLKRTRKEIDKRIRDAFKPQIEEALDEFEYKKLEEGQRASRFEYSEARLLLFFYLTLILAIALGIIFFKPIIPTLPVAISLEPILILLMSSGVVVFILGLRTEVKKYRNAVWRTIPYIAAVNQPKEKVETQIKFLEKIEKKKSK
jgi:hypothetical protein